MKRTAFLVLALLGFTIAAIAQYIGPETAFTRGLKTKSTPADWRAELGVSAGVDVLASGAKGDDATDDYTALQSAINTAASAGRSLYFPEGVYRFSSTLKITNGMSLIGHKRATLKFTGSGAALELGRTNLVSEFSKPIVLHGLRFEGASAGVTNAIKVNSFVTAPKIIECEFRTNVTGSAGAEIFFADDVWHPVVALCEFFQGTNGAPCIRMNDSAWNSTQLRMENNLIHGEACTNYSVIINSAVPIITGNKIEGHNGAILLQCGDTGTRTHSVQIANNYFETFGTNHLITFKGALNGIKLSGNYANLHHYEGSTGALLGPYDTNSTVNFAWFDGNVVTQTTNTVALNPEGNGNLFFGINFVNPYPWFEFRTATNLDTGGQFKKTAYPYEPANKAGDTVTGPFAFLDEATFNSVLRSKGTFLAGTNGTLAVYEQNDLNYLTTAGKPLYFYDSVHGYELLILDTNRNVSAFGVVRLLSTNYTSDRVLYLDSNKDVQTSIISQSELNNLDNSTNNIQDQLSRRVYIDDNSYVTLPSHLRLANNVSIWGRDVVNGGDWALIGMDTSDRVHIAAGGNPTFVGGSLSIGGNLQFYHSGGINFQTTPGKPWYWYDSVNDHYLLVLDTNRTVSTFGTVRFLGNGYASNRVVYLDANKDLQTSAVDATELNYLDGVTNNVQTQLSRRVFIADGNEVLFPGYTQHPNNTAAYGRNVAGNGNVSAWMIDTADQVAVAPGGATTSIGGALKMGNTLMLTTNILVLVPGGGTNQLQFINGGLAAVVPQ